MQPVEEQLGDDLGEVLLPAGPCGGISAWGEVQISQRDLTNVEDNCAAFSVKKDILWDKVRFN